jgi:hypothetical protein
MRTGRRCADDPVVEVVYTYPHCPYREVAHAAVRKFPGLGKMAALVWPAATRAEWVQIDTLGIEATTLAGNTHIAWNHVCSTTMSRSPLGRRTLEIADDRGRRIVVASTLPDFADLRDRVSAETHAPHAIAA